MGELLNIVEGSPSGPLSNASASQTHIHVTTRGHHSGRGGGYSAQTTVMAAIYDHGLVDQPPMAGKIRNRPYSCRWL